MIFRVIAVVLLTSVCTFGGEQQRSQPDVRALLQKLAPEPPDWCSAPDGTSKDAADIQTSLFERAVQTVTRALNSSSEASKSASEKASAALKKIEQASAEINAAWPEENRFHFKVVEVPPVIVAKMTIRTDARFFVFGVPQKDYADGQQTANRLWRQVGWDDFDHAGLVPWRNLDIYPLHGGPSGRARFLIRLIGGGCAGSYGIGYEAWEWGPSDFGTLDSIIKQEGSSGLDDAVPDFPQIGKLQTKGPLVTLPYCWFSAVDTWDNPSLCAVDTYDLSGDQVKFRSRAYNRPDLVPIAKAIEYAQRHDYRAVRGYCASAELARRLVRDSGGFGFADYLNVTRTGAGKEQVETDGFRFEVEKRDGRWVLVDFRGE